MSEELPPIGPTSHRRDLPLARRLLMPLGAVATVVLVVVALLYLNGGRHTGTDGAVITSTHQTSTRAAPTTVAPSPTPSAVVTPSPVPSPTPAATHSTAAPPAPTPVPARSTTETAPMYAVTVLNNSRVQDLGHKVAAEVHAKGWPIADVGNYSGRIAETTVYYAPGQYASAQRLASEFSSIKRVLPRFDGLPGHGLTLVVTRYWDN